MTILGRMAMVAAVLGAALPLPLPKDRERAEQPPDPDKRDAAEKKRARKAAKRIEAERIRQLDQQAKRTAQPSSTSQGNSK